MDYGDDINCSNVLKLTASPVKERRSDSPVKERRSNSPIKERRSKDSPVRIKKTVIRKKKLFKGLSKASLGRTSPNKEQSVYKPQISRSKSPQ